MKLHELLEKETILASSLRFKLQIMPTQIKSEVQSTFFLKNLLQRVFKKKDVN